MESLKTKNLIIEGVAGSGKSTLIKEIKDYYKGENILILKGSEIKESEGKYEIIIIEDTQDIKDDIYDEICKIIKCNELCRICLIGDIKQRIKGDERYLIYGEEMFNINRREWIKYKLKDSYRITKEIGEFINKVMYKEEIIKGGRESGNKPRYLICDTFGVQPLNEIKYYLEKGYKGGDILIIAPSLRSENSPVRRLEQKIRRLMLSIEVYVMEGEEDIEKIKDKVLITTIENAKSIERKVVIIYNFDDTYYTYYKRDGNRKECANELYICVTRCSEELTLLHHNKNDMLKFINEEELNKYSIIKKDKLYTIKSNEEKDVYKEIRINEIIKGLPNVIIEECKKYLEISIEGARKKELKMEEGEVGSLIITSEYERETKGEVTILKGGVCIFEGIEYNEEDIIIRRANEWYRDKTGIKEGYKSVERRVIKKGVRRMGRLKISKDAEYEKEINIDEMRCIKGYINCKDGLRVYEIKCNKEIKGEEYVKMGIIMYICEMNKESNKRELKKDIIGENIKIIEEKIRKIEEEEEKERAMNIKEGEIREYEGRLKELYKNNDIIEGDEIKFEYEGCKVDGKIKIIMNIYIINQAYIYLHGDERKYMYNKIKKIEYKNINNEKERIKAYYNSGKCKGEYKEIYKEYKNKKSEMKEIKKSEYKKEEVIKEYEENMLRMKELDEYERIEGDMDYKIYNIMRDEIIEIKSDIKRLKKMMEYIIYNKYINLVKISDDEFLKRRVGVGFPTTPPF